MKTKKILFVPSALLCFAALAACGSKNTQRFVNGFESPEFEEYFKLPGNLSPVLHEYGMEFVYEQARMNLSSTRSIQTTIQMAGSNSFFYSDDRAMSADEQRTITPFSSNSLIIYGKNNITKYDDELPVVVQTEESYRCNVDNKGNQNISNENDFSYISYVTPDPDVEDYYIPYTITKGTSTMLKGGKEQLSPNAKKDIDIAYKTQTGDSNKLDNLKIALEKETNTAILKDFALAFPLMGSGLMFSQYCDLTPFDVNLDKVNLIETTPIMDNINFYSSGDKNMYAVFSVKANEANVVSPLYAKDITEDKLIPAYQTIDMVAKFTLHDNNRLWYCDRVATNSKVFVTKDESLKTYAKPRCLCSEYYCADINYNSCGKYGEIEKIDETYDSTKYGIEIDIYDHSDKTYKADYRYDAFDSNLEHVGGVYDRTMEFKKLGYPLTANQRVFFGTFDIKQIEQIPTDEEDVYNEVTDMDFSLSLVDRNDLDNPISLLNEAATAEVLDYEAEQLELDTTSKKYMHVLQSDCSYEFTIFVTLGDEGEFKSVDLLTIYRVSGMAAPSKPAHVIG